jgi:sugar/nucleoside kinase (ribokinase family)
MTLVFGTICVDRVFRIARLPAPGGYAGIESNETLLGGEAANTALALLTWGGKVELAGNSLGAGESAALLLSLLRTKGLPTERLLSGRGQTPVCHIYVSPEGDRTMYGLGFGEPTSDLEVEKLPYRKGEWFTVDPNLGAPSRQAARLAHEAGMKLYLMDFLQEDDPIFPGTYWQSSTDWAGFRGNTQKNVAFVQKFVERRGCFCILSDGPNGLVAGSPELPVRAYPPYPSPKLVDSTGAGDMFRAGMLFGLEQGWETSKCLQFASAAGCLKCRSLGATTDVPSKDEILAHIEAHAEVSRHYV